MHLKIGAKCAIVVAGLALWGGTARADVQYTYTGEPFDEFTTGIGKQEFTSEDNVIILLSFSELLAPNMTYNFGAGGPPSQGTSLLTGLFIAGNEGGDSESFTTAPTILLNTNNSGNISVWDIAVGVDFGAINISSSSSAGDYAESYLEIPVLGDPLLYSASAPPGTWSSHVDISTTSVPEPASLAILASVVAYLAFVPWRRRTM